MTLSRDISIGVFEQAVKKNRSSMATRKKRGTQKTRQYSKDAKQAKKQNSAHSRKGLSCYFHSRDETPVTLAKCFNRLKMRPLSNYDDMKDAIYWTKAKRAVHL